MNKNTFIKLISILLSIIFTSQQLAWAWPDYTYEVFKGLRPVAAEERDGAQAGGEPRLSLAKNPKCEDESGKDDDATADAAMGPAQAKRSFGLLWERLQSAWLRFKYNMILLKARRADESIFYRELIEGENLVISRSAKEKIECLIELMNTTQAEIPFGFRYNEIRGGNIELTDIQLLDMSNCLFSIEDVSAIRIIGNVFNRYVYLTLLIERLKRPDLIKDLKGKMVDVERKTGVLIKDRDALKKRLCSIDLRALLPYDQLEKVMQAVGAIDITPQHYMSLMDDRKLEIIKSLADPDRWNMIVSRGSALLPKGKIRSKGFFPGHTHPEEKEDKELEVLPSFTDLKMSGKDPHLIISKSGRMGLFKVGRQARDLFEKERKKSTHGQRAFTLLHAWLCIKFIHSHPTLSIEAKKISVGAINMEDVLREVVNKIEEILKGIVGLEVTQLFPKFFELIVDILSRFERIKGIEDRDMFFIMAVMNAYFDRINFEMVKKRKGIVPLLAEMEYMIKRYCDSVKNRASDRFPADDAAAEGASGGQGQAATSHAEGDEKVGERLRAASRELPPLTRVTPETYLTILRNDAEKKYMVNLPVVNAAEFDIETTVEATLALDRWKARENIPSYVHPSRYTNTDMYTKTLLDCRSYGIRRGVDYYLVLSEDGKEIEGVLIYKKHFKHVHVAPWNYPPSRFQKGYYKEAKIKYRGVDSALRAFGFNRLKQELGGNITSSDIAELYFRDSGFGDILDLGGPSKENISEKIERYLESRARIQAALIKRYGPPITSASNVGNTTTKDTSPYTDVSNPENTAPSDSVGAAKLEDGGRNWDGPEGNGMRPSGPGEAGTQMVENELSASGAILPFGAIPEGDTLQYEIQQELLSSI